jgi:hypothetical protein
LELILPPPPPAPPSPLQTVIVIQRDEKNLKEIEEGKAEDEGQIVVEE